MCPDLVVVHAYMTIFSCITIIITSLVISWAAHGDWPSMNNVVSEGRVMCCTGRQLHGSF